MANTKKFGTAIEYLGDFSNVVGDNVLVSKSYVLDQIASASFGTSGVAFSTTVTYSFPMGVASSTTITTGAKGRYPISFNGTITGWMLVANTSSNVTLDIWKANNAIPTNANSIFGTKPSLTSQELNSATGLNIAVESNDIFILEVEANDIATYIKIDLQITQQTY